MENMANSNESLLEKHERNSILSEDDHLRPKPSMRPLRILLAIQILTMCLVPAAYLLGVRQGVKDLPPKIPTDVVSRKGLQRKLQVLDDDFWVKDPENKKFTGDPRPELDEAWDGLMKDMNIRVHPEEARQMPGFSSIELNDGTGDMAAVPTVFHNIHCLQAIREMFFPEYYLNTWEIFKPLHKGGIHPHMDHCIENLRQSVMCNADMSLYTYRWIPEQEEPEIIVGMEHVCADWSILADWAEKRSFPLKGHLLTSPYRDEPWDLSSLGLAAHNHTEDPNTLGNDE